MVITKTKKKQTIVMKPNAKIMWFVVELSSTSFVHHVPWLADVAQRRAARCSTPECLCPWRTDPVTYNIWVSLGLMKISGKSDIVIVHPKIKCRCLHFIFGCKNISKRDVLPQVGKKARDCDGSFGCSLRLKAVVPC